jgi:heptosyltransferase I
MAGEARKRRRETDTGDARGRRRTTAADEADESRRVSVADEAAERRRVSIAEAPGARRREILIVMMSALGDVVHVLPVVCALKRHDPGCRITWVLQPAGASLVRGHPGVDDIVIFDRRRGWRAFLDVRRELRARRFDLLLGLQTYFKAGLVSWLSGVPVRLGFDRARARDLNTLFCNVQIPARPEQHVQDQYFEFLGALGVPAEPVEWQLGPWPEERAWQDGFRAGLERPAASLVIATSNSEKDWVPERWAEVVDLLWERHGLQPVLVGGRSERELAIERVIAERARHRPVSTLGVPLRQLIGVLDASALVISLDTGPLHMAVALDRPVISLLGYNDPRRTGPYRRFHDLIIDAFHDAGESAPVTRRHRPGRMARVSVDDVADRVRVWEERYRKGDGG